MPQKRLTVELMPDSWQNILDTIRARDTTIASVGNFWTAIQAIERQLDDQESHAKD